MVKADKVFATATEDMDALTFGCNVLLRRLTFSEARKLPVQEIHFDKVLEGLELNHNEVCISSSFFNTKDVCLLTILTQNVLYSLSISVSCWVVITLAVSKVLVQREQ